LHCNWHRHYAPKLRALPATVSAGGYWIIVEGHIVGGIGSSSGTGEQDREVANAALAMLSGAKLF
jgi:uncharacterized protein GlcG (DUF336 family)